MRQFVKLLFVLTFVLLASCSTQHRVVYRDCDCNTTQFNSGWNNNQFWGWNNSPFGWNNNPYSGWNNQFWGWNDPFWGYNGWNRGFNGFIPRIQPSQPSRYERRQSVGPRPSRIQQNEPIMNNRRSSSPQIQRNSQPTRTDNVYPQRTQPSRTQTQPSRVQQRVNTPVTTQPTRSRVQNREN